MRPTEQAAGALKTRFASRHLTQIQQRVREEISHPAKLIPHKHEVWAAVKRRPPRKRFMITTCVHNLEVASSQESALLRVTDPRSGPRLCEAQWFMVPMRGRSTVKALRTCQSVMASSKSFDA
ncbi:MAG: hypothetical protein DMF60_17915 [Acidobacteria bacterium]|nr:MAG: hypothetical protein DMF60_17915 [Acidobacteriota bacterium]